MKNLVKLMILGALVASLGGAAKKVSCKTVRNEHGVMVKTCDGKAVMPREVIKHRNCIKTEENGKSVTRCEGRIIKTSKHK
jgi:hypothetical protein